MKKRERKKSTFWKEFKAFISKGNVLDLAIAVVLGAAFTAIVNGFVNGIINPLISLAVGEADLSDLVIVMKPAVLDSAGAVVTAATELKYGMFLQAIINFIIIGLCLFCGMKLVMYVRKKAVRLAELAQQKAEELKDKFDGDEPAPAVEGETAAPAPADAEGISAEAVAPEAAPVAEAVPAPSPDRTELLLEEIRDLLKAQQQA